MGISLDGQHLLLYLLVVARLAGIVITGPILSDRAVPTQAKVGFSCLVGLIVFSPLVESGIQPSIGNGSALALGLAVMKESLVGITIGFVAKLLFYALQMVAYLLDFQMGFGMAGVYDPSLGTQTSPLGSLVNWVALMVFLSIEGHHRLIVVLVDSYASLPLGWKASSGDALLWGVTEQLAVTTQVSIGLFGPVLVVLSIVELVLGVLSKAAPQMNILMVSLPIKIAVGFVGLALWIATLDGPLAKAFGRQLDWLPSLLRLMGV